MAGTEVTKKEFTTALSNWTNTIAGLVERDFNVCGVVYDEYSKQCAMNAMTSIYHLAQSTDKTDISKINTSNLREVVAQAASLKLNANAVPRECYFKLQTKKINGEFVKCVEMGVEGDGWDALLRQFGNGIRHVYPVWLVKEGDEFKYPRRKGVTVEPAEWVEKGESQKVIRVVYPVRLSDGSVDYLIAERDSVRVNLVAHIRNNMMNETFGICKNRYDATDKQKAEIKAKKDEIMEAVRKCDTLEEILECEIAKPYISAAWLDTPEQMFVRKMRNNAIRKFPKNLNSIANQSLMEMDDVYKTSQEEIKDNENSKNFIIESEAEVVDEDVFEAEVQDGGQ
jgi:hypothetical protein